MRGVAVLRRDDEKRHGWSCCREGTLLEGNAHKTHDEQSEFTGGDSVCLCSREWRGGPSKSSSDHSAIMISLPNIGVNLVLDRAERPPIGDPLNWHAEIIANC